MWNKKRCHEHPCLCRPCPKHCYLQCFWSLYNILHMDVEQGKLSQASMPLATMSKTRVFTALLFLYGLPGCGSGLTHSISETEHIVTKSEVFSLMQCNFLDVQLQCFPPNRAKPRFRATFTYRKQQGDLCAHTRYQEDPCVCLRVWGCRV